MIRRQSRMAVCWPLLAVGGLSRENMLYLFTFLPTFEQRCSMDGTTKKLTNCQTVAPSMVNPTSVSHIFFSSGNTITSHCGHRLPNTFYVLDCRGASFPMPLGLLVDTSGGFKTMVLPAYQQLFLDRWHDPKNTKISKVIAPCIVFQPVFWHLEKNRTRSTGQRIHFMYWSLVGGRFYRWRNPKKKFQKKK